MLSMRAPLTGTKRADGRWQITVSLTRLDGAKIRKTLYATTQREVQDKARRLLMQDGRRVFQKVTFSEVLEACRADRWPQSYGGKDQYDWAAAKLETAFGKEDVRSIDAPKLSKLLKSLSLTLSGRSVQIVRNVCSVILGHACEMGLIPTNPAKGLRLPTSAKPAPTRRLTPQEYALVLQHEPNAILRDLWEFLGETGLRPFTEATPLKSDDLFYSLDMWWVNVHRSKTESGVRAVPVPDHLAARLYERKGLLFPTSNATMLGKRNVERSWAAALKRAGIDHTNLYQLRKMCLSRWIANGLPDDVVKTLAGHSRIELTKDVYNRVGRDRLAVSLWSGQSVNSLSNPLDGGSNG